MGLLDQATNAINTAKKVISDTSLAKNLSTSAVSAVSGAANKIAGQAVGQAAGKVSNAVQDVTRLVQLTDLKNIQAFNTANQTKISTNLKPPFGNPLNYYTAYNCIFSLSVLTDYQVNFPDETYRQGKTGVTILKSASLNPDDRVPTPYGMPGNTSGKFDFFLDDLVINSAVGMDKATGNTNATALTFVVTEPYSMGGFMEAMQIAAKSTGNEQTYLTAPYLLTIEFKGWDVDGKDYVIPGSKKYIPIKIREVTMRVTGRGSVYNIEAYPWNEQAFSEVYTTLKTPVNISGSSVQEMLQTGEKSLQKVVNDRLRSEVKQGSVAIPDEILILFPSDISTGNNAGESEAPKTATTSPASSAASTIESRLKVTKSSPDKGFEQKKDDLNAIGAAKMGFSYERKGDAPFGKDNVVYDETTGIWKRGDLTVDPSTSDFRFAQGSNIVNAINQVILQSDYCRQALKPSQVDKRGMIPWFKVETQVYNIDSPANLQKTGDKPRLIVFRIIPYLAHSSRITKANSKPKGYSALKEEAIKEYNYIYTGKNLDIIDFEISFQAGFYQSFAADNFVNNESEKIKENTSGDLDEESDVAQSEQSRLALQAQGVEVPAAGSAGTKNRPMTIKNRTDGGGGGGVETQAVRVAGQFHDAITNGADMIELNMTILGDPYYITDSGVGNYTAPITDLINLNGDGSMNYQNGEVDVIVYFRTPLDIDQQAGTMSFGPSELVKDFSGLYQVLEIDSRFSNGRFTQLLKMNRRLLQEVEGETSGLPSLQTPGLSDEQIAANNAALGDFPG